MSYLIEMHYHTPETSPCCLASSYDAFPYYSENKYSAVVITDHYCQDWFDSFPNMDWLQKIKRWLIGYEAAKNNAKNNGINIILGMEIRFSCSSNDYLVYGIDEDLLFNNPELYKMSPLEFRSFADKHKLFFSQAHPFRPMNSPDSPMILQGIEIYNGNPRHNSKNDLAQKYAKDNNLIALSGSDFHQMTDLCRGGMYFSENPANSYELSEMILNGYIEGIKTT